MAVNLSQEQNQDTMSAIILPDKGHISPQCESYIDLSSLSSLYSVKIPSSKDTESSSQNDANPKNDITDISSPYILELDIEKGKHEELGGNLMTEDPLTPLTMILQREITSQMGGKLIQFLMKHSFELSKFALKDKWVADKIYDISSSKLRKYKRTTSFNSRRVVLLFSVLSCVGTIILICLTLRVRMNADGLW